MILNELTGEQGSSNLLRSDQNNNTLTTLTAASLVGQHAAVRPL